jgi:SAM-dependent methyltransferase
VSDDPILTTGKAYDLIAPGYDNAYQSSLHRVEDDVVSGILRNELPDDGLIVDIGCGTGLAIRLGNIPSSRYLGIDISPGMLERARAQYPDHRFIQGDMIDMETVEDGSAAAVICLYGGVSYFANTRRLISRIRRALRPDGYIFLMFLGYGAVDNPSVILDATRSLWHPTSRKMLETLWRNAGFKIGVRPMSGDVSRQMAKQIDRWSGDSSVEIMSQILQADTRSMLRYTEGHTDDAYWQIVHGMRSIDGDAS